MSEETNVQPFKLAGALIEGEPTVVLVVGGAYYRLDEALPRGGTRAPQHLHEMLSEWERWQPLLSNAAQRTQDTRSVPEPDQWLLPARPGKLVCAGVNYYDHLREMGTSTAPELPYCFLKPVSMGMVPSGASVSLPVGPKMIDWEAELAVIVGRTLHGVHGPAVLEAIAGYTIINDLSARDWIRNRPEVGIDWVMMKGYDGFSPIGPFLTPRQFVTDPQALSIRCSVNGELKQDSSTAEMVFGVQAILEHLAGIMTLEPGDVIATGTPAGVGFGQSPQQFLKPGDTVVAEVGGLGRLETYIVAQPEGAPA